MAPPMSSENRKAFVSAQLMYLKKKGVSMEIIQKAYKQAGLEDDLATCLSPHEAILLNDVVKKLPALLELLNDHYHTVYPDTQEDVRNELMKLKQEIIQGTYLVP